MFLEGALANWSSRALGHNHNGGDVALLLMLGCCMLLFPWLKGLSFLVFVPVGSGGEVDWKC